jgi:hypothetical protein
LGAPGYRVQHSVGIGRGPTKGDEYGIGRDELLDHLVVAVLQMPGLLGRRLLNAFGHLPASPADVER